MKRKQKTARLIARMEKAAYAAIWNDHSASRFRVGRDVVSAHDHGRYVDFKLNGIRLSRAAIVEALLA